MANSSVSATGFKEALAMLDRAANFDTAPFMPTVAREMDQEARGTFASQGDPWGEPWPAHAQSTIDTRRRRGSTRASILIDSARMFDGITPSSTDDTASVTIPAPAEVHQSGTTNAGRAHSTRIPARPMFPIRPSGAADVPQSYIARVLAPVLDGFRRIFA